MTAMTRIFAGLAIGGCALAQERTVLDGVYTEAQARRGEAVYALQCSGCHGDVLQGKSDGPLRGQVFMDRWREDTLDVLFDHIRTNMPARAPGTLAEDAYLDALSFILEANGFPKGEADLKAASVGGIRLIGKDGAKPLPSNATVKTVGCLAAAGGNFTLTNGGALARTTKGDEITDAERAAAQAAALGEAKYRLGNMDDTRPGFRPGEWVGARVFLKGVLTRQSSGDRIHVLAMQPAGEKCAP